MGGNGDMLLGGVIGEAIERDAVWYLPIGISVRCLDEAEPSDFLEVLRIALYHAEMHFLQEYKRRHTG